MGKYVLTGKEELARSKVCLPLDGLKSLEALEERVNELSDLVGLFKIGKGSYTRFGPAAVKLVQNYGANVFLDLKYHDIPETVRDAANGAASLGVYMFNVHVSGNLDMMKAAVEGAKEYGTTIPKITGVTILTSIDQMIMNEQLRIPGKVEDQVLHYAKLAERAGLDGIVCSAADLYAVRPVMDKIRPGFMYVTPGIQGPNTPAGADQKRVFTPVNAIQDGSTILVVGRAITGGKTPDQRRQNAYDILQDMVRVI